jgi:FkbM family methyltransferase
MSGDPMPEAVLAARQTWIDRHPGWKFRVWRPDDVTWLENRRLFDRAETYAQKADIARYEILYRLGGVYLDTDMECLRPLDELLDGCDFFAARQYDGVVNIAIVGAVAQHPILRRVIDQLPASCFFNRSKPIYFQTGPLLFDRVITAGQWEKRPDIRIFPDAFFYPYGPEEPWRRAGPFARAYAVHHWAHSWRDGDGLRVGARDLLPDRGSVVSAIAGALSEGGHAASELARRHTVERLRRAERRAKSVVVKAVRRTLPQVPTIHGLPWGETDVLVSTPFGTRLLCPSEDLSIAPEVALTGVYDPLFVDFLGTRLRSGMTFVDVGANVGLFTIVAAARVGAGGRVFAFECNPELLEYVQRNVAMNWFDDRIQVIPKAAHRDSQERMLSVPSQQKMLGSLTRFPGENDDDDRSSSVGDLARFLVGCERLDSALRHVPYIDLLKIDVEGGEAAVIDGATEMMEAGRIGMMSVEYRENALREDLRDEMDKTLKSLVEDRNATLHQLGRADAISLDEALTVFNYAHLLIRFPNATISP